MSKTIDFDQYRKEKKDEKIIIKAFGQEVEAPASPSLSVVEDMVELREKKGEDANIPPEKLIAMLKTLLGEGAYETLTEGNMELADLDWLFGQIFARYRGQFDSDGKGDGSGKGSTSSKNGEK